MSFLKYLGRLQRMHDLINRKATGTPLDFARRIGVSRTVLMENLKEMKELGASIEYCPFKQTYYYSEQFHLQIGHTSVKPKLK